MRVGRTSPADGGVALARDDGSLSRRAVAVGLGLALLGACAATADRAPHLRARQVAADVWFVQGEAALGSAANRNFISNAGFVVTDDGVLVVDALGSPVLAEELIDEIRRVTSQPIRYVVVTHYHADHIYGLQAFKAAGATVVAHTAGQEYLNSDTAWRRMQASRQDVSPWVDENTRLVAADRWLDPVDAVDTILRLGSFEFHVRHVGPAHTPEDLVVFVPQRGVLFAGDLVFKGRIPFVGQADSRRWIESLDRLLEFRPKLIIPGHGAVSSEAVADLELTRDYLVYLRQSMGEAARNLEPFDEAYAKADWSRFEHMPLFRAANRMNAYNTFLLMEQQSDR
jgi:glyoxylase-like metal-dependent hydrolase (beta-lactamase superfamily II)